MFVNRYEELESYNRLFDSNKFEFSILYGRRRVGKTALVLEASKNRNYGYYLATDKNNLIKFSQTLEPKVKNLSNLKLDWEVILDEISNNIDILIIDEFQNLIKEDKAILSTFQRIIDTKLSNKNFKLVILGSSISMINSKILTYTSPLYGRKTHTLKLTPIKFFNLKKFFPDKSLEEIVNYYGFADGIPYYLIQTKGSFWEYIEEEINAIDSYVKDEIKFIMKYEFEDPGTYFIILEAIANGKTKVKEIKDYTYLQRTDIAPYLKRLIDTEFILKEIPLGESIKSRNGSYYIKDQFVSFWFRFIFPNLSSIEQRIFNIETIKNNYNTYLGFVFEKISKEYIINLIQNKRLTYSKIGNYNKHIGPNHNVEIDICAVDEINNKVLFAECKFKDNVDANKVASSLFEKKDYFIYGRENRLEEFYIFGKSFSKKIRKYNGINVTCIDIDNFKKMLK